MRRYALFAFSHHIPEVLEMNHRDHEIKNKVEEEKEEGKEKRLEKTEGKKKRR